MQLELSRVPGVVGIEEGEVVAARGGDAGVPGHGHALVLLPEHADAIAVRGQDLGGRVGGAVVDDDDLERCVALPEGAVDGLGEEARVVVRRDNDGNRLHCKAIFVTGRLQCKVPEGCSHVTGTLKQPSGSGWQS